MSKKQNKFELPENQEIKQQAVVIIHGIGEQKPMDTLRSFVYSIHSYLKENDDSESSAKVFSKPDKIADLFETRRLKLSGTRNRPSTDFYEFYWAHNMRDSTFEHTFVWLKNLIWSKRNKVPKRLKPVRWAILVVPVVVFLVCITLMYIYPNIWTLLLSFITSIGFILTYVYKALGNVYRQYLADAARYFTPIPDNIEQRVKIRQQGVEFLKKLHNLEEKKDYERIIIVGHSLGSVVAYDLLRLLWIEYHATYDKISEIDQSHIKEINKFCANPSTLEDIDAFQNLQYACWKQQRAISNKWLITDLITIGAAINYADYLTVNNIEFEQLVNQREFPTCPPIADEKEDEIFYHQHFTDPNGKEKDIKILHHAAPFAITRWTNIFFSTDFVGGEMQRIFGKGIKDIKIDLKGRFILKWFYPKGHTNYWDGTNSESIQAIVKALKLRH